MNMVFLLMMRKSSLLTRAMAEYFDAVVDAGADAKLASNWIMGELSKTFKC